MTSTAYYPTIKWYYYNATGAAWVDISGYVLTKQGVSGHWGMRSNKYTDRLAATGEMRMLLDNTDGVFDPDDASALTGWAINTKVKMVVTFDGVDYVRFYGKVDTLKFSDPNTHEHTAQVLVSDWMGYAYKKTLGEQSIETYKRGGELCAEIVTAVGQTPLATSYAVGDYGFPAAFDSMTTTTKAATELNKIVLSENGYFYNRHDKVNGETLVFEAESTRNSTRTVSKLPKLVADCGFVLKAGSATDHVLIAGSATDKVVMNEAQDAHINGTAQRYERTHGENILNKVTVTAYPKRVDTVEQTLYSLGTPLMLSPGETKTVTVKYQNATTKESCNAITELCSQPVATTDYLMNKSKAGTSTNITSSLTVSVVFHTADADVTLTNASAYTGYVTRLYLKGYGVYQDSPIKAEASNSASITAYGDRELNVEQQYQRDIEPGRATANRILIMEKDPRTKLEKVTLIANTSSVHMLAFLNIDIGDMVKITESDLNLADYYYVNGIEFSVADGGVITFSWVLSEPAPSISNGQLTLIGIEFSGTSGEAIDFGRLANISALQDPDAITIIMDVYLDAVVADDVYLGKYSTNFADPNHSICGWRLAATSSSVFHYQQSNTSNSHASVMERVDFPVETAVRMAVSIPNAHDVENFPATVYRDGEAEATSSHVYFSGASPTYEAGIGNKFTLGGYSLAVFDGYTEEYNLPINGVISRIKIYDVALTAAEIAADFAGTTCSRGLVFYGPVVPTSLLGYYTDLELTESDLIYTDGIRSIGVPHGAPICRLLS